MHEVKAVECCEPEGRNKSSGLVIRQRVFGVLERRCLNYVVPITLQEFTHSSQVANSRVDEKNAGRIQ